MGVHSDAIDARIEQYVSDQVEEAEGARLELEGKLAAAEDILEGLERELTVATADLSTVKEQRDAALSETARLQGLLSASQNRVGELTAELDQAKARIAQLESVPAEPIGEETEPMAIHIESFPGATDDDKLDAAFSYALAQTISPPVELLDKIYDFRRPQTIVSGKKLVGGRAVATQQRSSGSHSNLIKVSMADGGAWFRMPSSGSIFDFELSRLSMIGNSTTDLIGGGNGVMWTSNIHDIAAVNFRHILGSPIAKLLLTACTFGGSWNVNNSRNRSVTIGGSDCSLWESGLALFDSPTNLSGTTDAHIVFDYMSKSRVGGLYITAEGGPAAIIVNGGTSSFGLEFNRIVVEGRNAGAPSKGSVVRVNGGTNTFNGLSVNFAASDLTGTPRSNEGGVISLFGGSTIFNEPQYARATGVAETVPLVYASGTSTKVAVNQARGVGAGWTGKPRVKLVNGATVIDPDSVTYV